MGMAGFTAEATLYQTPLRYGSFAAAGGLGAAHDVVLMDLPSCRPPQGGVCGFAGGPPYDFAFCCPPSAPVCCDPNCLPGSPICTACCPSDHPDCCRTGGGPPPGPKPCQFPFRNCGIVGTGPDARFFCCGLGQQCCSAHDHLCCSLFSQCCGDICCPPGKTCVAPGQCCGPDNPPCGSQCCPPGEVCADPATGLCCSPAKACGNRCCSPAEQCIGGQCCIPCGGVCCAPGQTCVNGVCCSGTVCGSNCCPPGGVCCDPAPTSLRPLGCCNPGSSCCGPGCCPPGKSCCCGRGCCPAGTFCCECKGCCPNGTHCRTVAGVTFCSPV
jgi:hypothetical protein